MKLFTYHTNGGTTYKVCLWIGEYENKQTALQLINARNGDPLLTASICVEDLALGRNELVIKNYSENEGVLNFLIVNNIVELLGKSIELGCIRAPIVRLLPEDKWK